MVPILRSTPGAPCSCSSYYKVGSQWTIAEYGDHITIDILAANVHELDGATQTCLEYTNDTRWQEG